LATKTEIQLRWLRLGVPTRTFCEKIACSRETGEGPAPTVRESTVKVLLAEAKPMSDMAEQMVKVSHRSKAHLARVKRANAD
jgi:hypothetical protein